MSLRTKISLAMALVGLLVVAASIAVSGYFRYGEILRDFQTFVRSVAGTTAIAIDPADVAAIDDPNDDKTPEFRRVRAILEESRRINGLKVDDIFILRVTDAGPYETEFLVMLQAATFIGDKYSIPQSNRPALQSAVSKMLPAATRPYTDEYGRYISGYAPLFDADGRPFALLVIDVEISIFIQRLATDLAISAGAGLLALALAMIPGVLLANRITSGIKLLSASMQRFRDGQPDVRVSLRTGDEIEALGSVFNEMILSLAEKLALLPYVSRFTAEAVRRSRTDPSWLTGTEQSVSILFADLRGFTRFSENRDASALVRELNSLLSVQADVVVSAGGDVDKFIGDAVMAVFLDDEHSPASVFECAARLIQRVRDETDRTGWQLSLGIGIHCGRAVVGSIGSQTRRDFTAIGHTVNLASRLCDHAQPWEVLISADFRERLPADARARFHQTEPMNFKNVERPVATYAWRAEPVFAEK